MSNQNNNKVNFTLRNIELRFNPFTNQIYPTKKDFYNSCTMLQLEFLLELAKAANSGSNKTVQTHSLCKNIRDAIRHHEPTVENDLVGYKRSLNPTQKTELVTTVKTEIANEIYDTNPLNTAIPSIATTTQETTATTTQETKKKRQAKKVATSEVTSESEVQS